MTGFAGQDHRGLRPVESAAIGVVIVSSWPTMRAALRAIVEELGDAVVLTGAAGDDAVSAQAPDALLIDVDPEDPGLATRLAERYPNAALALLVDSLATFHALTLPIERATAVLPRDANASEIGAALRAVLQGFVVLDSRVAPFATRQPAAVPGVAGDRGVGEPLTERERQVLELVALGRPNKTIARELGISEHTAKFHVGAILAKLGAASRTEAVTLAARRGLLAL